MSVEGFRNEDIILMELNGKRFGEININLRKFLEFACGRKIEPDEFIVCRKIGSQNKADLYIKVDNLEKFRVSIKMGKGNSVHQEPVEEFIDYLSREFEIPENIKKAIRFFIWGDGTFDGSGDKRNRMSAQELRKKHPRLVETLKRFFKEHKEKLIERFVVKGPKSRFLPDFIYYGTAKKGLWAKSENVIKFLSAEENESRSVVPVGRLTFQAWNRAIKEDTRSEHKRGVIQLKWPTLEKDLKHLMGIK